MYISKIITNRDMAKWKKGNSVFISAQTGSGKSYFIKNVMYKWCSKNNYKILLFSNRDILKEQNIKDLEDKQDIIKVVNYQYTEARIMSGSMSFENFHNGFDVIVFDECHELLEASTYSRTTDLLLKATKIIPKNKIFIFMTATPYAIMSYNKLYTHIYNLETDYSYIKQMYFFDNKNTIDQILKRIPRGEKAIYFSSDIEDLYNKHCCTKKSAFICSKYNKDFYSKSSQEERDLIIKEERFNSKILFTTPVLDNGINIKMPELKHIIIDIFSPVTFIQCLGRKRIMNKNDRITLYVKNYHNGILYSKMKALQDKIYLADELKKIGRKEFEKIYRKVSVDSIIDLDFTINEAKYYNCKYLLKEIYKMFKDKDKMGYKRCICRLLKIRLDRTINGEFKFEKINLVDYLSRHMNKIICGDDLDEFKNTFFSYIFSSKKIDYRKRGIKCVNAILEEDGLPYIVRTTRIKKGKDRDKTAWIVLSTEDNKQ